jgi:hypothetical protein
MNQEDAAQSALSLPVHASIPFTPSGAMGFGKIVQFGNAAATLGWLRHETPADVENVRRLMCLLNDRLPKNLLEDIATIDAERLGMEYGDIYDQLRSAHTFYIERYVTESPGYIGPVLLVLWPAGPGAVTTYIQKDGRWQDCNTCSW